MKTFYLRDAYDVPHKFNPLNPDFTVCGLRLSGMKPVTELQVLVYLGGRSCTTCTPSLAAVHIRRKEAA